MTTDVELMSRITTRPGVLGGKPIIRDLRIAVEHIFAMLAAGDTVETILYEYPALEPEDVQACFVFAVVTRDGVRIRPASEVDQG